MSEAKRQRRCLLIETNPESGEIEGVKPLPEYSPEQEDFASIWNLHLWKNAGSSSSEYAAPPADALGKEEEALINKNDNIERGNNVSQAGGLLKKSTPRDKALESLQKALSEFSKLLNLTSLINQQEFVTLSTCHRQSAVLPKRNASLPSMQVLSLRRQLFKGAEEIISHALAESVDATNQRQKFFAGVLALKEHWRLIKLTPLQAAHILGMIDEFSINNRKLRNCIAVDCSYATVEGESSTMYAHLVPLLHGPHGPTLSKKDQEKVPLTIKLSLRRRGQQQQQQQQDGDIVSAFAWNQSALDSLPKPKGYEDIHTYLQRRQHEAFCIGIFSHIHNETIEHNDRWVASWNNLNCCLSSSSSSAVQMQPINLCPPSLIQGQVQNSRNLSLEVTLLERNEIVLSLPYPPSLPFTDQQKSSSSSFDVLELAIKLVPLDENVIAQTYQTVRVAGSSTNASTSSDIPTPEAAWSAVLHQALVSTQLLYLRHIQCTSSSSSSSSNQNSLTAKISLKESLRTNPLKMPMQQPHREKLKQTIIYQLLSAVTSTDSRLK